MDQNPLFRKKYGSFRCFFRMLWKAPLPFLWILAYIGVSFALTHVGVSATEYSARLFAGDVDAVSVVIPFLLVTLLSLLIGSASGLVNGICRAFINRNLRRMVWRKAVRLPLFFYESNEPKQLISRVTTDTTVISQLTMQVFVPLITMGYSTFVLLRKVSSYDSALMWSLFAVIPLNVLISFILGRLHFGVSDRVNRATAELTAGIAERANQTLLIKTMGTEEKECKQGEVLMEQSFAAGKSSVLLNQLSGPVHAIAGALQVVVIILVGRGFYSAGRISLAEWIAYYGFATQLANTITGYLNDWTSFKSAQGATDRVAQVVDTPDENTREGVPVTTLSGGIRLEDVCFSYGEAPLFEHLDLEIPAGKITALVGPSGSGKSTVLNLIDRLYPLREGRITVGADDTARFTLASYRRALGYVTQECVMYAGTLRENLTQGIERSVTDEDLDRACEGAGILDFVRMQPEGYDLAVGEGGASLSGGQRQRFTVARALLRQPDYLLLDEATAAMDIEGKDLVWTSIRQRMAGKTVVFVAHDAQTVRNADYIIVLRDGKAEAAGDRDTMLASNPYCLEMMEQTGKEAG